MLESDILEIRSSVVTFYVLRDDDRLYLIDTGFIGGWKRLMKGLRTVGWDNLPVNGILLTHGHLDHTFNAARISEETGAWIAAPRADESLVRGEFRTEGLGRIGGWLQTVGSAILRYRPPRDVRWFDEGHEFDFAGGIRAITLPGHTAGHTGLFLLRSRLLFSGDLFASFGQFSHRPPRIFNARTDHIAESMKAALSLDPAGVMPCHGFRAAPEDHLARLTKLAMR